MPEARKATLVFRVEVEVQMPCAFEYRYARHDVEKIVQALSRNAELDAPSSGSAIASV